MADTLLAIIIIPLILFGLYIGIKSKISKQKTKSYVPLLKDALQRDKFQVELDASGNAVQRTVDTADQTIAALLRRGGSYTFTNDTVLLTGNKPADSVTVMLHEYRGSNGKAGDNNYDYHIIASKPVAAMGANFYARPDKISTASQANAGGQASLKSAVKKYEGSLAGTFYVFEQEPAQDQPGPAISPAVAQKMLQHPTYEFELHNGALYVAQKCTFNPSEVATIQQVLNDVASAFSTVA